MKTRLHDHPYPHHYRTVKGRTPFRRECTTKISDQKKVPFTRGFVRGSLGLGGVERVTEGNCIT